jgi:hypothetical protein
VRKVQSSTPIVPAIGPYVAPNESVASMYAASTPMRASQRTTDTAAPKASQEASGCRRRGEYSKRRATDATANVSPTGQRAIRQIASNVSPQASVSRMAAPPMRTTRDSSANSPAVTASARPTRYFRRNGPSLSTR